MFKSLRVQIIQPCMARCKWCGTWKKNDVFRLLQEKGISNSIHDFYLSAVKKFRPESINVSGGEPLLLPGIGKYMSSLAEFVDRRIYLFTSYQFPQRRRENLDLADMPWDKITLTHTTAGFDKDKWLDITEGFPFDQYIRNIKELSKSPWRKHVKFIINHENIDDELKRFSKLIAPDDSFGISLKLMNNQAGNFGKKEIKRTKDWVLGQIDKRTVDPKGKLKVDTKLFGEEAIKGFLKGDKGKSCPYRSSPLELRFALFKQAKKGVKLKYRFCPHFPSNKYFVYKIGKDNIDDIENEFNNKSWHKWCSKCRLKLYVN
ncbi:radical SAM protein [Spirochaetota bacterium]